MWQAGQRVKGDAASAKRLYGADVFEALLASELLLRQRVAALGQTRAIVQTLNSLKGIL